MADPIRQYLREVRKNFASGQATEQTYRPALEQLIESLRSGIEATNEPRRVRCGAPDIIVEGDNLTIGHVECKDIATDLKKVEKSEQLKRYRQSLDNLILTDYLEFRYYYRGEQQMRANVAAADGKGKITALKGGDEQLNRLFSAFLAAEPAPIGTPQELAGRMADIAKEINHSIRQALALEESEGTLHAELKAFRQTILRDITVEQFADMYAQTICYGLFSARVNVPDHKADEFSRQHAAYDIPKTNPFLRQTFDYIGGVQLDDSVVWAVELLVDILRRCDMHEILKDFGKKTGKQDPVFHFYETFLDEYAPTERQKRGVYYTPEPVVNYIVRSIDEILKRDFDCPTGLADNTKINITTKDRDGREKQEQVHRVQILDPAAGTGTFLCSVINHIYETMKSTRGAWGGKNGYVSQHLLPRVHGFELMMAPYAVAHMKIGLLLRETGYDFPDDKRLGVYITNTLEEAVIRENPLPFANFIAREANEAARIKTTCPVMVVLGNPPYSGHSANKNDFSRDLIKNKLSGPNGAPGYFECDGEPLGERNPKWLNDDYVKFIRYGQYRIEKTGYGILGFITNHGYLDNPTFRGMRQSLMQTFDDIYILDLHGNVKKKETASDGSKDENVFDIQQGVAICIMVKKPNE